MIKWVKKKIINSLLKEPEWWRQTLGTNNVSSGVSVTPDTALQVSAVYGCVRILAETIASLPLNVYERNGNRTQKALNHPLQSVLHDIPNGIQTAYEMREFQMVNLGLRGNQYSQTIRNGRGEVVEIIPLYTQHTNIDKTQAGKLVFDYQELGAARVFSQDEIWRTSGLASNGVTGLSPISLARESIGLSLATEMHGAKLFSNGAQVPSVLEMPGTLSEDAYDRLRKEFDGKHGGVENAHKTLILEGGASYKTVGMTSEDAQFLESRKFQISEISRWYRVPLHMLSELDKATFSNIEHQSIEFVVHTIRPWLVRIEQSINRDLLTPKERRKYFIKHNVEGLLRGDTASRYEAYGKGINDGWLKRNEVREWEDLNPEEGLDEFLIPLNMGVNEKDSEIENFIEQEIKAISIEKNRKKPEDFQSWMPDFYDRHLTKVASKLNREPTSFINYASSHIKDVLSTKSLNSTFEKWRKEAYNDLMRGE